MTLREKIKTAPDFIKSKIASFEHEILDVEIESKSNQGFLSDLNNIEMTIEQKMILATLLVN